MAVLIDNNSLTGLSHFPLETTGQHSYNVVLRWLCDTFYRMNVEYDIISSAERDFSSYDYLVVPALYSASEELLTALSNYVKNGGNLIATFRTGFSNEQLKIYSDTQPHILHKCLGIHYDRFTYPKNVNVVFAASQRSSAHDWMDLITCDTAKTIATYDHPAWNHYAAVTKNSYGKGTSLYLGTLFSDELLESILRAYLSETGCQTVIGDDLHFPLILKRGQNELGKELFYYFNYSGETQTVTHVGNAGIELLSEKNVASQEMLTLAPWDLAIVEV